ncbi:MAG: [FeFe] hydrogenase H-cluster maturation GTPase HydF [Lachnospirales bacterium]|jgi:[FeFe] hydrogenase H-cluster maturation GTPase HydF|nr:[FeFe] hydrogenase H-cluster maturation GTPase HydF [Eubacterium sp.]
MGLNDTPKSDRIHIGIFGRRNAGKSSIINAITSQNLAVVSKVKGTTTDPVQKAMELLPLGPVMIIDTPGIDDEGELGKMRVEKSYQVLNKTDIALLVVDGNEGLTQCDKDLIEEIKKRKLPYLIILNKSDEVCNRYNIENSIWVSAETKENIWELKERISKLVPNENMTLKIVGDLLDPEDIVVLVVPIDSAAPKGRLILPQQQTIRDVLEAGAISVVTRDTELPQTLKSLGKKPKIVVTDSQAFGKVKNDVPEDILLTSFSILFARYKGDLAEQIKAVKAIDSLKDGDYVLISEGCSHHRQCDDIGTVKIPRWLKEHSGKKINYEFSSGTEFPRDLSKYKAVIHCGGCTLNEKEMKHRIAVAKEQNVPITNYGIFIAYTQGILKRSLQAFPEIAKILD